MSGSSSTAVTPSEQIRYRSPTLTLEQEQVRLRRGVLLQRAHQPRPPWVDGRLRLGQPTLVDHRLDHRVIAGEPVQLAVAQQVGTRVADVRDADPQPAHQERDHRGAGAAQVRVLLGQGGQPGRRVADGGPELRQQVDLLQVGAAQPLVEVQQRGRRRPRWRPRRARARPCRRRRRAAAWSWPPSPGSWPPAADVGACRGSSVGDMGAPLSSCGDSPGDPLSATREPTASGPLVTNCHAHGASMAGGATARREPPWPATLPFGRSRGTALPP